MANKGRSEQGLFGTVHHYDEHGKKVGRSEPGLFGGYTNYDAKGKKIGHSDPGLFGGYTHYDTNGKKTGHSNPSLFGGYQHRDAKGRSTGSSDPGLFGSYHHKDNQGCYVATCVYGSYDCPQVWTLRRFRDNTLAETTLGRAFIRTYYAISPTIVKWFGSAQWFRRMWKGGWITWSIASMQTAWKIRHTMIKTGEYKVRILYICFLPFAIFAELIKQG